jgi:hypothetical protein
VSAEFTLHWIDACTEYEKSSSVRKDIDECKGDEAYIRYRGTILGMLVDNIASHFVRKAWPSALMQYLGM